MDRISELSDEILVKILSFLSTKQSVSTSVLSKRWEGLWMLLPKLDYDYRFCEGKSLTRFLNRTFPLHRAPVISSLRLRLHYSSCKPKDVRFWVAVAVSRHLRELDISYHDYDNEKHKNVLPSSLYACNSLSVLKLYGKLHLEVPRRMVLLPRLKTLELQDTYIDGESLRQLLRISPVLEDLSVGYCNYENVGKIIVNDMSLRCLSFDIPIECYHDGLEINTPSLKYLKLDDRNCDNPPCLTENMPELEEAYVDVRFPNFGTITSVKRLTIFSEVDDLYGNGCVFNKLEHLTFYECTRRSFNLLASLLRDSPNLRALDISPIPEDDHCNMTRWNQPLTVPACFVSSLQTFEWSGYLGTPQQTEVAVYILKNARLLKTATFMSNVEFNQKLDILKELSLTSRASTTCQLEFD